MAQAISWKVFKPENLMAGKPTSREVTTDNGEKLTVWKIPLKYKYPNGSLGDLHVDYPELYSSSGIKEKDKKKYKVLQLVGSLHINEGDEDAQKFYDEFATPYNDRIVELISEVETFELMFPDKKFISKKKDKDEALADKKNTYNILTTGSYMQSVFYPREKESKQLIEGANPLTLLNLMDFDGYKTLFTDMKKNPLSDPETGKKLNFEETVELLSGVGFTFRPRVVHKQIDISKVYRSTSAIKSAIVYNFVEGNNESYQDDVAEELQQKYGEASMESFNNSLLALKRSKKEKSAEMKEEASDPPLTGTVYSSKTLPSGSFQKKTTAPSRPVMKSEPDPEETQADSTEDADGQTESENNGDQEQEETAPEPEPPVRTPFPLFTPKRQQAKKK